MPPTAEVEFGLARTAACVKRRQTAQPVLLVANRACEIHRYSTQLEPNDGTAK